jgi:hypothetical protein
VWLTAIVSCPAEAVAESLAVATFAEPPPVTETWFVRVPLADGETLKVAVMDGYPEAAGKLSLLEHVNPEQDHPVPDMPVRVNPAGGFSVTVTAPQMASAPVLLTLIV